MIVYIFRHGEAENKKDSPDKTDAARRLTEDGVRQVREVCTFAKKLGMNPNIVMSSPLVRAKQTAELAQELLNPNAKLEVVDALEPESNSADVYAALSKHKRKESVVLVTHLPILGHLFADLLRWEAVWKNFEFKNGAIARIDCKGLAKSGTGTLLWLLPAQ